MAIYSIDVRLCATLYIDARDEAEAMQMAAAVAGSAESPEMTEMGSSAIYVSSDVEMSPAVTFYGTEGELQLVEEDDNGCCSVCCSVCGNDLSNPSAAGAEDGICGECIDDGASPSREAEPRSAETAGAETDHLSEAEFAEQFGDGH